MKIFDHCEARFQATENNSFAVSFIFEITEGMEDYMKVGKSNVGIGLQHN